MAETNLKTRAEQVRDRRSEHPKKSASKSRRKTAPRSAKPIPPVVTRGGRVVMPTRPVAGSRTRRRYDVALNAPGAELRLPTMPTFRWSWRIASGLLMAFLAFALYSVWTWPMFRVSAAQISGLQRVNEQDVNLVLGLVDTPVFVLEPDIMRQNLMDAFPELSSAQVNVGWPNVVSVTVNERTPVLAWSVGGQTVWVDAQGMSFPVRGADSEALDGNTSLVLVDAQGAPPAPAGFADFSPTASAWSRPLMSADLVSAILLLRGFAPQDVMLLYDPTHGLGWRDPQGWQVYFGPDGKDMGQRLQVYQAMVAKLKAEDIQPALVSVEYLHAPFYRMDQ